MANAPAQPKIAPRTWRGSARSPSATSTSAALVPAATVELGLAHRVVGPGGRVRLATGAVLEVDALYRSAFEVDGE